VKLLAVSDVESPFLVNFHDPRPFEGVEVILSCGDLKRGYLDFLMTMLHAPLLYVPGNHDKDFGVRPPEGADSADGRVVVFRGLRIAGLGGARSLAQSPQEYSEAFQSKRARKLRSQIRRAGGLDILMTHVAAEGLGDGEDRFHQGFACYKELLDEFRPQLHLFGHQHPSYGRKTGPPAYGDTRLINTCGYVLLEL
jgi:Icc-related predicted phosphoesterase